MTCFLCHKEIKEGETAADIHTRCLGLYIQKRDINIIEEQAREETAKAFGGCKNCYGKGYATVLQFAEAGMPDFDSDDVRNKRWKLPEIRFCSCGRGKELKKRLEQARHDERKRCAEIVKNGGTGHTILTIQHNGETFINERQLIDALLDEPEK